MFFLYQDHKERNPYLGLALDEAISFTLARDDSMYDFVGGLRIWASRSSIILGRVCDPKNNLIYPIKPCYTQNHSRAKKIFWESGGIPLCRRLSGGGTVLHGTGSINYSIFLSLKKYPKMFGLKYSYSVLLEMIVSALRKQGIDSHQAGLSDIVLPKPKNGECKISGNAQFRQKQILVFHGTLILKKEFIAAIKKYLAHPPKEPDYRKKRSHDHFISHLPSRFHMDLFIQDLMRSLQNINGKKQKIATLSIQQKRNLYSLARKMAHEKYCKPNWVLLGKRE